MKKYIILLFIGIGVWSCTQKEDVAAYITIEPFQYTVGADGVESTKITDGWVYVNNEFLGAFDLPKTIPVLESGESSIVIDAGIKENGIAATPDIYPFYQRFSTTARLIPGETIIMSPTTTYDNSKTNILFSDNFENGSHKFPFDLDGDEDSKIDVNNAVVKEGTGAGKISLDTENAVVGIGSQHVFDPPSSGTAIYLEMDYKTDVPMFVGISGYNSTGQLIYSALDFGVNAKTEWNKIYFNISDNVQELAIEGATEYQIVIRAQIPQENDEFTMENAEIYLDNIKLISL